MHVFQKECFFQPLVLFLSDMQSIKPVTCTKKRTLLYTDDVSHQLNGPISIFELCIGMKSHRHFTYDLITHRRKQTCVRRDTYEAIMARGHAKYKIYDNAMFLFCPVWSLVVSLAPHLQRSNNLTLEKRCRLTLYSCSSVSSLAKPRFLFCKSCHLWVWAFLDF